MKLCLFLEAYCALLKLERAVSQLDFARISRTVRECRLREVPGGFEMVHEICSAIDRACVWYWKTALCLQRSAATAYLLKRHGVPAQLVIGAQTMPYRAHAWVEVNGCVVNDTTPVQEMFFVLDRVN